MRYDSQRGSRGDQPLRATRHEQERHREDQPAAAIIRTDTATVVDSSGLGQARSHRTRVRRSRTRAGPLSDGRFGSGDSRCSPTCLLAGRGGNRGSAAGRSARHRKAGGACRVSLGPAPWPRRRRAARGGSVGGHAPSPPTTMPADAPGRPRRRSPSAGEAGETWYCRTRSARRAAAHRARRVSCIGTPQRGNPAPSRRAAENSTTTKITSYSQLDCLADTVSRLCACPQRSRAPATRHALPAG